MLLCNEHAGGRSVSGATCLSMDLPVTKMGHNLLRDMRPPQALSRKLKSQDSFFFFEVRILLIVKQISLLILQLPPQYFDLSAPTYLQPRCENQCGRLYLDCG